MDEKMKNFRAKFELESEEPESVAENKTISLTLPASQPERFCVSFIWRVKLAGCPKGYKKLAFTLSRIVEK